jgi:hemerythrin
MMSSVGGGNPAEREETAVLSREWDESLTTGVPSVDDQHRHLVGFLAEVLEAMEQGCSRAEVGRVLDELDR